MKSQWPTPTVALTPLKILIPVLSIKLSLTNVTHTHTRFLFFFSMHGNSRPWCWIIGPPLLPSAGGMYGLAQGRPKKENTPTKRMKWKERYFSFSSSSSPSWMESIWIYCASKASDFQWENNEHTVRLFFFHFEVHSTISEQLYFIRQSFNSTTQDIFCLNWFFMDHLFRSMKSIVQRSADIRGLISTTICKL